MSELHKSASDSESASTSKDWEYAVPGVEYGVGRLEGAVRGVLGLEGGLGELA